MTIIIRRQFIHLLTIPLFLSLTACKLYVTIEGNGAGEISSDIGTIQCGNDTDRCSAEISYNEIAVLTAQPRADSQFVGWHGACEGNNEQCTVIMSNHQSVTARFEKNTAIENNGQCGTEGAKAECLQPTQTASYYIDQSIKYFRTMESSVSPLVVPNYSKDVIRWEWPPWLLLTGFGEANMIWTDLLLKLNPTSYTELNCQAFDTQPFGRCHVVFDYSGELCPIYEEFTFNDQGEITFIEAWTDAEGWLPMAPGDYWAEGENIDRLSTRTPGLGNTAGQINLNADWMVEAAHRDADVAELVRRAKKPYKTWLSEMLTHVNDVRGGCHPNG